MRSIGRAAVPAGAAPPPAEFKNPFSFWPVVGFAVFLGVVIVLGRALGERLRRAGGAARGGRAGLADVDSVTVSMARLVPEPLGSMAASLAILAAVASNMLSKLGIAVSIGRGRFAAELAHRHCGLLGRRVIGAVGGRACWDDRRCRH